MSDTLSAGSGRSAAVGGEDQSDGAADPILAVEGLTKTYGSGEEAIRAVDDLSLSIERGTVVGLLGPNGAGKTTTIKTLLGLVLPDEGRVRIDGTDPLASPRDAYQSVGAMLEGARNVYWRLTVRENLRYFARLAGRPADPDRIEELIDDVGLSEKAETTVNELSRGMKQKASLACTLARETPIAFLDEPTLGLDVESSRELRRELRRMAGEERTIVVSSHDMDVIEDVCDRVIVMNEGRIVADDTVENLIDAFRTQAYRVTVEGDLAEETRRTLEERFGAGSWSRSGDRLSFEATRVTGEAFFDLVDTLRAADCRFVSIDSLEADLEEAFLHVVSDDRAGGGPPIGNREREHDWRPAESREGKR